MERAWPATTVLIGLALMGLAACDDSESGSSDTAAPSEPTATAVESAVSDKGVDLDFSAASPDLSLGAPIVRPFDGLPLTDIAVSPDADRIAVSRDSEVCIVSTSPEVPTSTDRCYPLPSGIAPGSVTWSPDGTAIVFHHNLLQLGQDPDLVELDLATGELTVLTDDGVPIVGGEGGDIDVAPTFAPDGTLYFFRLSDPSDGVQAVLYRYGENNVVTPIGPALVGVPPRAGRSVSDDSIVIMLSGLGNSELVSVDIDGGTNRSIVIEGPSPTVADVAGDRALLVAPSRVAPSSFELGVADFNSGIIAPIDIPQLAASSMRVTGGGLSPDGAQVALILADQEDPDGHLLLVADIAANGSVGPLTVLASGPEFAPNGGDLTIKPAGLGRLGEIAWTDAALIYSLGPDQIVALPLL